MTTPAPPGADAPPVADALPVAPARRSLWRHGDFLKIWTASTISLFGSQVSAIAIPTIAIITLGVSPFQAALLGSTIGLHETLWVGAIGGCFAFVPLLFSPVMRLRDIPAEAT